MKRIVMICALTAGFAYAGCQTGGKPEPEITLPPTISLLDQYPGFVSDTICDVLQDRVMKTATGDTIMLRLHLKGGNTLSQYKLEAHENFDCHGHEERPTGSPWDFHQVVDLSSKDTVITEHLPIPADAATGNYHFNIHLLDNLGNEAEFVEFSLVLE